VPIRAATSASEIHGVEPLDRYDVDRDGDLDPKHRTALGNAIGNCISGRGTGCNMTHDFNEDGKLDSADAKLWEDAYQIYLAREQVQ
jgi:hypothetical protein